MTAFPIRIPEEEEAYARKAQADINRLYNSWKAGKLGSLSPLELMGRIAFQMARRYEQLNAVLEQLETSVDDCDKEFDNILLKMD